MQLHDVMLNGVQVSSALDGSGSRLVATSKLSEGGAILMTVPSDLILSLEKVWVYAKTDKHLLQVLDAMGDYARVLNVSISLSLSATVHHQY